MKSAKKVISLCMVLAIVFSFIGCGNSSERTSSEETPSAGIQESAAANEKGLGVDELVIGHYGPLTGAIATSGQAGQKGAQLAVKMWNEKGGVNGTPIKYIAYDDQSNTEGAVKAVNRLINEDQVHGLLGSQLSGNIQATGDLVEEAQIPEVGTGISPVWLQQGWTYLFRALANSQGGAGPMIEAMKSLKANKIATLVYQDEGSKTGYALVKKTMEENGIEITTEEVFQPNDTDWTGQLSKMISTNPDAMLVFAQGEQLGTLLKQLRNLGYNGYVFGQETCSLPDIRKVAGEAANGLVFYAPYCLPDTVEEANSDAEKTFLEAYVKEYGDLPVSDVAYRCFDAANILLTGFEKANSVDGTTVRDALKNLSGYKTLGGVADFAKFDNGECMSGFQIFITHEGKNISFSKFLEKNAIDTYK